MPFIKISGIDIDIIQKTNKFLVDELHNLTNSPREWFLFEYIERKQFFDGKIIPGIPYVVIDWFDRGYEQEYLAAKLISECFLKYGIYEMDIYFNKLDPHSYYECNNAKINKPEFLMNKLR